MRYNARMPTREEIKKWIDETPGVSRQTIADELGVTVSCVYNWLSDSKTNNIPAKKLRLIEKMMAASAAKQASDVESFRVVGFAVTETQYENIADAAINQKTTVDRFARAAVLEKVQEVLKKHPPA